MDENEYITRAEYNEFKRTFNTFKSIIVELNIKANFLRLDKDILKLNENMNQIGIYYSERYNEVREICRQLENTVNRIDSDCKSLSGHYKEISQKNKLYVNVTDNNIRAISRDIEQMRMEIANLKAFLNSNGSIPERPPYNGRESGSNMNRISIEKNAIEGNAAVKETKYRFMKDYIQLSGPEFIEKYNCMEMSLCNFSEMRTGQASIPEFQSGTGNFLMITCNNTNFLLPEKSFLENPSSKSVISRAFEIDNNLQGTLIQADNVTAPSVLKKKDARTWTCAEKGKIKR